MAGRWVRSVAALAGATWLALAGPMAAVPALAAGDGLPDRRVVATGNVDLPGGDIRSIFNTSLPSCVSQCLDDRRCAAFTFNTKASACFLKSAAGPSVPYQGALSGRLVAPTPAARALAETRAGELGFLPYGALDEAARVSAEIGSRFPADGRDAPALSAAADTARRTGDRAAAVAARAALASQSDAAADWIALARAAATMAAEQQDAPYQVGTDAAAAAIAGYLRAGDAETRAAALALIAVTLEQRGNGRESIDALKLSAALRPDQRTEAALARLRALYGMRVVNHSVDSDAASPRICLTFSEPVAAGSVDFADYVRVAGADLPVEAKDNQACVEGVVHGSRYQLSVRAGLPAASGEVLQKSADLDIYVRDRSPAVRFQGRAYVLPKSGRAAIPLTTVNLDAVELRIHRIGERNLLPAIQGNIFDRPLSSYAEQEIAGLTGAAVWQGSVDVTRALNKDVVTAVPVGAAIATLQPGTYVMSARVPDADRWQRSLATQWFVITDIGLATLTGEDGLHVFARALASAAPAEGLKLRLLAANNQVLAEAATDARGYAQFAAGLVRGAGGDAPALLTAEGDGDFAFLDLAQPAFDLSDRGVDGRPAPGPVDVFVSTERGIYRPGETVHATVLARDSRAHALPDLPLTAILFRPDGVEAGRALLCDGKAGGYAYDVTLGDGAQRGPWRLAIHADPKAAALAAAEVLVEDFLPERIAFDLTLPDGALPARPLPVEIDARYLYGAPAAGLALEGEAYVASGTVHPDFPGYSFGLLDQEALNRAEPVADGIVTDEEGKARVLLRLPTLAPHTGLDTLTAVLRLRDASGRPVERSDSRPLLPEGIRVGIKPLFDGVVEDGGLARFELIVLGTDGKRAALPKATWTLSRVQTTYQWYQVDGYWNHEVVTTRSRVASGEAALATDAPARIEAPVEWGHYELRLNVPDAPFAAASVGFDAGWYAAAAGSDTPDVLEVGLDKPAYRIGDVARLRLVARDAGKVLVTVVDSRLMDMKTVDVPAGESVVDLPVTEAWGAGAYVTATLVRPMDVAAGHNPARALGLRWAPVDPGPRKLAAHFEVATAAKPRGPLPAVLRIDGLPAGETAFATVAAVDVGILNLTSFEAPAPDDWYFGQRRLGMSMRDLYGRLIDGNAGAIGRLRSGGDGGFGMAAPPTDQDLLALFIGPVQADAEGRIALSYDLPDFDGTVRLMAIVWTARGVGHASADVVVRDDVVASLAMPRFLAPDDESRLQIDLTHAGGPAGEVTVAVTADPILRIPADAVTAKVTLAEKGRATLRLPVTALGVGDAALTVTLTLPDGRTVTKQRTLSVRANDPTVARTQRLTIAAGGKLAVDAASFDGLRPDGAKATLAVGPFATIDVPRLLLALDGYPYGCTEQIASRAMPLLYLDEVAVAMGLVPRADVRPRVEQAIRGVLANQSNGGGFGLWGAGFGDLWLDAYATDFLGRAKAGGYTVPAAAFRQALDNLRNRVAYVGDFESGGEALAYALLVLSREGVASIGDLRYYADARAEALATPLAKAQLGAALALYGEPARADGLFRLAAVQAARLDTGNDRDWREDYGSALRDIAGVLALAAEAGSDAVDRGSLADRIAQAMHGRSASTQEMAWALLAAQSLAREAAVAGLAVDGTPLQRPILPIIAGIPATPIVIENRGAAPVEAALTTIGIPATPVPAGGDGYTLTRRHFTLEGAPVALDKVAQNDRVVVVLDLKAARDQRGRLIVDSPLPAGLEIDNPRLLRAGDVASMDWLQASGEASSTAFRSDRFLAAIDVNGGEAVRLAFIVRAVSPGRFHYPAAKVEDMYRPMFQARTAAATLSVSGPLR